MLVVAGDVGGESFALLWAFHPRWLREREGQLKLED